LQTLLTVEIVMSELIDNPLRQSNVVDRAAETADKAVEATRRAADALLDNVSSKVESVRSTVSPTLDRVIGPWDSVTEYTKQQPLKALCRGAPGRACDRPAALARAPGIARRFGRIPLGRVAAAAVQCSTLACCPRPDRLA
jgi:hypothetical protein